MTTLRHIELGAANAQGFGRSKRALLCSGFKRMRNLTVLEMPFHGLDARDAGVIARAGSLRALCLFRNSVGPAGAAAISARLKRLTDLDISCNDIRDEGVVALSELTALTTLRISFNSASDAGVAACLGPLTRLTTLQTCWNGVGAATEQALSQLTRLVNLDMSYCDARCALRALPRLTCLRDLQLVSCGLVDTDGHAIGACDGLTSLNVSDNAIRNEGMMAITSGSCGRTLARVCASRCLLGYAAANALSKLPALEIAALGCNDVLDVGLHMLTAVLTLRLLDVTRNGISDTVARVVEHNIRSNRPDLTVHMGR